MDWNEYLISYFEFIIFINISEILLINSFFILFILSVIFLYSCNSIDFTPNKVNKSILKISWDDSLYLLIYDNYKSINFNYSMEIGWIGGRRLYNVNNYSIYNYIDFSE